MTASIQSRVTRRTARLLGGLAFIAAMQGASATQTCNSGDLGCAIFNGDHALAAHLRDDTRALPPSTSRCANCHAPTPTAGPFAPSLTRDDLLTLKVRRGGPATRYDQQSFCKVVRSGVDPSNIIVRKAMPRYELSDQECAAVWGYLSRR